MNKKILVGFGVASALAAWTTVVRANVGVELTLSINTSDPTYYMWDVYGALNDPNNQSLGLHGISVDVTTGGGMYVVDAVVATPVATEFDSGVLAQFAKGFLSGRSDGSFGMNISSSQETINMISPLSGRTNILPMVGKRAFSEDNIDLSPTDISMPVWLASGSFDGAAGWISVQTDVSRTTLLPSAAAMPEATEDGAPFTPVAPAFVHGHTFVTPGGTLEANSVRISRLTVQGQVLIPTIANGGQTSVVNKLEMGPEGRMDLCDTAMIVDYSTNTPTPLATIRGQIASAFAGGAWTGPGLGSSNVDLLNYGVGYGEASKILGSAGGAFGDQTVGNKAILIRRALYGDTNLGGSVTIGDFIILRTNFGASSGKSWADGDFDYNGSISIGDFSRLRANFGKNAGSPAAPMMAAAALEMAAEDAPAQIISDQTSTPTLFTLNATTPQLILLVDPATGAARITVDGGTSLQITGYEIRSASMSLIPANYRSLYSQSVSGWSEFPTNSGDMAEYNLMSFYTVGVNGIDIGRIFNLSGQHDLTFEWSGLLPPSIFTTVRFQALPEPSVLALLAMSAAGLLARRKRRQ